MIVRFLSLFLVLATFPAATFAGEKLQMDMEYVHAGKRVILYREGSSAYDKIRAVEESTRSNLLLPGLTITHSINTGEVILLPDRTGPLVTIRTEFEDVYEEATSLPRR